MSDSDYEQEAGHPNDETPYILRRRSGGEEREVAGANSARKRTKTDTTGSTSQVRLPTNAKSISTKLQHLNSRLHGLNYDENISLRVVVAVLKMQLDYLKEKSKNPNTKAARIRERICEIFSISPMTYTAIMKPILTEFNSGKSSLYSTNSRGNFNAKMTRIPHTQSVVVAVREFVRERRKKKERTTGKQVLELCIEKGWIVVAKDSDKRLGNC